MQEKFNTTSLVPSAEDLHNSLTRPQNESFFIYEDDTPVEGVVLTIDPTMECDHLKLFYLNIEHHRVLMHIPLLLSRVILGFKR